MPAPEDSIVSDIHDVETFVADDPAFAHGGSNRNDVEHHQGDKLRKMEDACRTILECIGKCSYTEKGSLCYDSFNCWEQCDLT